MHEHRHGDGRSKKSNSNCQWKRVPSLHQPIHQLRYLPCVLIREFTCCMLQFRELQKKKQNKKQYAAVSLATAARPSQELGNAGGTQPDNSKIWNEHHFVGEKM